MGAPGVGGTGALIERDGELGRIEALLADIGSGRGATVLIEGAPGIGKTALMEAARRLAADGGVRVLDAQAAALEREFAFGVVQQLFEPIVRRTDDGARRELFAGAARLAEEAVGLATGPDRASGSSTSGSALHGLYWLCANLADQGPLLLAIDDLHWADEPSLRFLAYLGRRVAEHPLLLCTASRPPPVDAEAPIFAALSASWDEVLRPRPLSDDGVARLVRATLSADAAHEFCGACARASGGNPLLLVEALAALRADGVDAVAAEADRVDALSPETLTRALLARLARLGPAATAVAHAVATLGGDADLRRVARLTELEPEGAAAAVEGLRREGILATGKSLAFVHPLVRNAVDDDLGEPARGLAQLRAARLLRDEGETAEHIAPHLLASATSADPWVVETLRAAATAALARGAPEPAVALLERALAEPADESLRAPLLRELGRALARTGRLYPAADALRQALELTSEPRSRAEITVELSEVLRLADAASSAVEIVEDVRRRLDDRDSELALLLEVEIAHANLQAGKEPEAWIGRLEAAVDRATAPSLAASEARALLAYATAGTGKRAADDVARLALSAAKLSPSPGERLDVVHFAGAAMAITGHVEEAKELLDLGIDAAARVGDAARFSLTSLIRSRVALEAGRVRDAEADARAALDAYQEGAAGLAFALGVLVLALVERGRIGEAEFELTEHGLAETRELGAIPDFVLLQARGGLRIAQGRHRDATEDLTACGAMLARIGFGNPAHSEWRSEAALAHLGLGEVDAARRLAVEELELARRFEDARSIGHSLRTLGLVVGGERGLELLRESVSVLDRSKAELQRAHSLVALGSALRRAGRRRDSRDPLRAGLGLASRCGAPQLAERAREELVAAGGRPRRAVLSGPDSLTASELRVARLVVEGQTNREIAQALFVTRRTVEVHLTSVYRKLEIGSRKELPTALEPVGDRARPTPMPDS